MTEAKKMVEKLKPYGLEIGDAGRAGDAKANEIMRLYTLLRRCPGDMCALTLLDAALEDWLKARGKK